MEIQRQFLMSKQFNLKYQYCYNTKSFTIKYLARQNKFSRPGLDMYKSFYIEQEQEKSSNL